MLLIAATILVLGGATAAVIRHRNASEDCGDLKGIGALQAASGVRDRSIAVLRTRGGLGCREARRVMQRVQRQLQEVDPDRRKEVIAVLSLIPPSRIDGFACEGAPTGEEHLESVCSSGDRIIISRISDLGPSE